MFIAAATSDSDAGAGMRRRITDALGPIADTMASWRDSRTFFTPGGVDGSPASVLDAFSPGGKADPDFAACVAALGPDLAKSAQELFGMHSHAATTSFVDCVLTRNIASFCTPAGRERAKAALEFYYWSRENGRHPSQTRLTAERMNHLEDDTALGPGGGGDSYERTWEGPQDAAVNDDLKSLLRNGYLDADDFGLFPRKEIRHILHQINQERTACANAGAG